MRYILHFVTIVTFFGFLVGIIPAVVAEEEGERFSWKKATWESKYFIHFQAQVRNADGSLVSVIETFHGEYLSNSKTEFAYSQLPLKQVVEISNKKYEMKQLEHIEKAYLKPNDILSTFNIGYEIDGEYIAVFHAYPPIFLVGNSDIVTIKWTIFKKI